MRYHIQAKNNDDYVTFCEKKNLPWDMVFWCENSEEVRELKKICLEKKMGYININLNDPAYIW